MIDLIMQCILMSKTNVPSLRLLHHSASSHTVISSNGFAHCFCGTRFRNASLLVYDIQTTWFSKDNMINWPVWHHSIWPIGLKWYIKSTCVFIDFLSSYVHHLFVVNFLSFYQQTHICFKLNISLTSSPIWYVEGLAV